MGDNYYVLTPISYDELQTFYFNEKMEVNKYEILETYFFDY